MVFKKGDKPWNKGLTGKDPRVQDNVTQAAKTRKQRTRPAWNKGLTKLTDPRVKKMSEKLSKTLTDNPPIGRGKGIHRPGWPKGKKRSKESVEKMKETKRSQNLPAWNKGLTKHTDERVAKYAETLTGRKTSDETRKKLSDYRLSLPKKYREKIARRAGTISMNKLTKSERIARAAYAQSKVPKSNTSIELILKKILEDNNIIFEDQKYLESITCLDCFIQPNICLYADGDYWHNYPDGREVDKIQTTALEDLGYNVLRFWGSELRDNPEDCLTRILKVL